MLSFSFKSASTRCQTVPDYWGFIYVPKYAYNARANKRSAKRSANAKYY